MANWRRLEKKHRDDQVDHSSAPGQGVYVSLPSMVKRMSGSYARELRALGQTLERFKFISFELALQDGKYSVVGRTTPDVEATISFIRRLRQLVAPGNDAAFSDKSVDLSFSAADIENLDAQERAKRAQFDKIPDAHRISQVLRGVGAFLDRRRSAGLLGIKFGEGLVTVRFFTADRRTEEQRQDLGYFYDYLVKMYLRRSTRPQNLPKEPTLYSQWDTDSEQEQDPSSRTLH